MRIADSYLVKLPNETTAWLAVGKEPIGEVLEVRPMIIPVDGLVLRNKETGELSWGHWLRGDDTADKWEEIPEPQEEQGAE